MSDLLEVPRLAITSSRPAPAMWAGVGCTWCDNPALRTRLTGTVDGMQVTNLCAPCYRRHVGMA